MFGMMRIRFYGLNLLMISLENGNIARTYINALGHFHSNKEFFANPKSDRTKLFLSQIL